MSFIELLKIEFMKVKRSKIVSFDFRCPVIGGSIRNCEP